MDRRGDRWRRVRLATCQPRGLGAVLGKAVLAWIVAAVLLGGSAGARRSIQPDATTPAATAPLPEGLTASARRAYVRFAPPSASVAYDPTTFAFGVGRYDTAAAASRSMDVETGQIEADGEAPLDVLDLAVDAAAWYLIDVPGRGVEVVPMTVLIFREGAYLYFWQAWGSGPDPLPQLRAATKLFLGQDLQPDPVPNGAPLLDHLPGPEDLPRNVTLILEESEGGAARGTPGAATPAA